MVELPNEFKIRIINRYDKKGKEWLNNINSIVEKYKQEFQLEDIELIENLSMNVVLFAKSYQYGNVVIKIGAPGKISINEINVMKYYSSNCVPKCYYSCIDDRVMILERISPSYSLDHLGNLEERVKVFSNISKHLLILANGKEEFPTFEEIFTEKIEYAYKNKQVYNDIIGMIDIANNIYDKMKKMDLPKYILHDDLHHKNILKTENDWKAIDPHGIIGEKVIETSHFIRAEIEHIDLKENSIDEIITLVSEYFKEDKKLITETLYINIILKIIWYIKNRYDKHTISYNINICKKLLPYISK